MLIGKKKDKFVTYIGYTNNLVRRLRKHNTNKGAKYTRGNKWNIIFTKSFKTKKKAFTYEYFLKNNKKLRKIIKDQYLIKCFQ